jgi:GNAT superfamily N-acetyltransferase
MRAAMPLSIRVATAADIPLLEPLVELAIDRNQRAFLDADQIASSHAIMGVDHQLVDDGTYYVVTCGGRLAGCGGWSRRATLYGGDHSAGRDAALLDPARDPARIRAMYTQPDFTRRGVGRLIVETCERAARQEGFARLELMATLSGRPLYETCGFVPVEETTDAAGGSPVPLVRMSKSLAGAGTGAAASA